MSRFRGFKSLFHDAVEHTTDLVEEAHESVARKVVGVASLVEPLEGPAQTVDKARAVWTSTVFATIRGTNRAVEWASDLGLDALEQQLPGERPEPRPRVGSPGDALVGAVNGVLGDFLHRRGNPLDLGMDLRGPGEEIPLDTETLAQRFGDARRVAVLVHGLAVTEWSWFDLGAAKRGEEGASFGERLHQDMGLAPLYLRYNTGRPISHSGAALCELLDELCRVWPGGIEEIVLVGHSMGGLVIRSATHQAHEAGAHWLSRVSHVVAVGSPHRGAPLEKAGQLVEEVLGMVDLPETLIPARVLSARSAGIKDLGFDRSEPLVEGPTWTFIATTVTQSPDHPLGQLVGDLMVRVSSAEGPVERRERFDVSSHRLGGVAHAGSQTHPDVYAQILSVLRGPGSPS